MVQQLESPSQVVAIISKPKRIEWEGQVLNSGRIESASIVGGNLSLLQWSLGTPFEANWEGKILMIEEIAEDCYKVDRMLQHLKSSGVFKKISGLLIGDLDLKDEDWLSFGYSLDNTILNLVEGRDIPIVKNFPIGHTKTNEGVLIGAKSSLETGKVSLLVQGD